MRAFVSALGGVWLTASAVGCALMPANAQSPWPVFAGASPAASVGPRLNAVGAAEDGWQPMPDAISDAGYEVLGGELAVDAQREGASVGHASVTLFGPTLASRTVTGGPVVLEGLAAGASYRVEVRAPGCATCVLQPVVIQAKMRTTLQVPLTPGTTLRGQVRSAGGPIEGAVVSDGVNSTLTDAEGRYVLAGVALDARELSASKAGFAPLRRAPGDENDFELTPRALALYWDGEPGAALRRSVEAAGFAWAATPDEADSWLIPTPNRAFGAERIEAVRRFVAAGGSLVLWGEWGASARFDPGAANALLHPLGAHCNPDLIRNVAQSERLIALPAQVGSERFGLNLYGSASLFALAPEQAFVRAPSPSYRVMAFDDPVLALARAYGRGKVVVLGDSSAWEGERLQEAANAACLKALLRY